MLKSSRLSKTTSLKKIALAGINVRCVIDVGIQYATIDLIEVFPEAKHYLFEPVEEYYRHIKYAYRQIDFELVEAAVSNQNGFAQLAVASLFKDGNISHGSLEGGSLENCSSYKTVKTITLDSYFKDKPLTPCALLKIDVDGHEDAVLRGAIETLRSIVCVVVECTLPDFAQRVRFLEDNDFNLWDICEPYYYNEVLAQVDVIMLKSSTISNLQLNPLKRRDFDASRWQTIEK